MTFSILKPSNAPEEADDIFISYSRSDGKPYAQGVELALSNLGWVCFWDMRGTDAAPLLPETLFQKVRLCKTLVLLGSPGAIEQPENITAEVREFANSNGTSRIIPICFGRDRVFSEWSKAPWYEYVEGKSLELEDPSALKSGEPSPTVVKQIDRTSNYIKSKDLARIERQKALLQRRRILVSSLALITVLFVVGGAAAYVAVDQFHRAVSARSEATVARAQADITIAAAREAETNAMQQVQRATELAKVADVRRLTAEQNAGEAELLKLAAQADATTQQAIADSRSLANGSQMIFRQHPDDLTRSLSVAVNALQRFPTVEADAALRASLGLFPRVLRTVKYTDDIAHTAFSPDGQYFSTLTQDNKLRVYHSNQQKLIKEIPCNGYRIALSNNAAHAVIASGDEIRILDLNNGASHVLKTKHDGFVSSFALSPGGKYLAVSYVTPINFFVPREVEFLEVGSGKLIKLFSDDLDMYVADIAFGANGDLAFGGGKSPIEGLHTGRVLIWPLSAKLRGGETGQELTEADFLNFVDTYVEARITAIALGADISLFATDKAIWKRNGIRRYDPVLRIPVVADKEENRGTYQVEDVALNRDGTLSVVRRTRTYVERRKEGPSLSDGYFLHSRLFEVLDVTGQNEALSVLEPFAIWKVGFEPGGKRVGVLTSRAGVSTVSLFIAGDKAGVSSFDITAKQNLGGVIASSSNLDFVVIRGERSIHVRNVWTSETFPVLYDATLTLPSFVTVGRGGRFLLLIFQDTQEKEQKAEDSEEEDVGFKTTALAAIYRLQGNSYVQTAQLRLNGPLRRFAISPDGRFLATVSFKPNSDHIARVYSVADGRDLTFTALRKMDRVSGIDFSPDGRFLLTLDESHENQSRLTRVWRLADHKEIATLSHLQPVVNYLFSPGGRYLVEARSDKVTSLVDLSTGSVKRVAEGVQILSTAFSSDERYLGLGDDIEVLRVYRTSDINEVARIQHDGPVSYLAFSDDNRFVATGSSRLDSTDIGRLSRILTKPTDELDKIADSFEHRLRVWFLRREDLLDAASARIRGLPAYAR